MFPILLDLARARVVVIGDGEGAVRRLAQLDADGSGDLRVFSAAPGAGLESAAGTRLVRRLPTMTDLAGDPEGSAVETAVAAKRARARTAAT